MKEIYQKYKKIINYIIFGVITTFVTLIIYYLCVNTVLNPENAIQLQIANALSWTAGVLFAYFTNSRYVFESKEQNKVKEAGKFFIARLVTLLIDMLIMYAGVTLYCFNDKIIKIISQVIIVICNYVFSKLLVFKN